ncbi:unnamed protein product [Rotaria sp. Silwood1]|nr:unnamed protein product [Rotaria sp. Silwood1]CAF1061417.1 unnamed protein product [Rotaria sp. Silwood1]CAF3373316.1 unnamed protein product [Rotaria sp. Silwood1]CAF3393053.1 unnamed protein product [Rotaria sp. Silwood1]
MNQESTMTERCSIVLNEIKQLADGEDLSKSISLEDLDGKERNQIYNFIETEYCNRIDWLDFVNLFCGEKPIHTLLNSKLWRQRTLGQARITPKTNQLAEYFVRKILHEMQTPTTDVVLLHNDEAVLQYNPLVFRRLMDNYHGTFFKVIPFRLVKLPQYNYFVKEYFDPSQSVDNDQIVITRCEFKCIPLPFLMQCIKKYEDKPITEIDRKVTIEYGHVATLDEFIF